MAAAMPTLSVRGRAQLAPGAAWARPWRLPARQGATTRSRAVRTRARASLPRSATMRGTPPPRSSRVLRGAMGLRHVLPPGTARGSARGPTTVRQEARGRSSAPQAATARVKDSNWRENARYALQDVRRAARLNPLRLSSRVMASNSCITATAPRVFMQPSVADCRSLSTLGRLLHLWWARALQARLVQRAVGRLRPDRLQCTRPPEMQKSAAQKNAGSTV